MLKKLTLGGVLLFLVGLGVIGMDKYLAYCKNHPTDTACPSTPTPTPSPSPSPSPSTNPSPSPSTNPSPSPPQCKVPSSDDPNWTTQDPKPNSQKQPITAQAISNLGDHCHQDPYSNLRLLADELVGLGECADVWADSVLIKRNDGTWEQRHAVRFSDSCYLDGDGPNVFEGVWIYTSVLPSPSPPNTFGCSDPLPNTDPAAWKINTNVRGAWADNTPTTIMQCSYCEAIGMSAPESPRCGCPMRNECPGYKCEERSACETYVAGGGYKLESRNGATCQLVETNQLMFYVNNGNCRVCNLDGTVCSGWY